MVLMLMLMLLMPHGSIGRRSGEAGGGEDPLDVIADTAIDVVAVAVAVVGYFDCRGLRCAPEGGESRAVGNVHSSSSRKRFGRKESSRAGATNAAADEFSGDGLHLGHAWL